MKAERSGGIKRRVVVTAESSDAIGAGLYRRGRLGLVLSEPARRLGILGRQNRATSLAIGNSPGPAPRHTHKEDV
jgi:hypothetical protein